MTTTQHADLMKIGRNAYASIAEMVSALSLDWDRLIDLRDERDDWDTEEDGDWATANPEDAEELAQLESERGEAEDMEDAERRIAEDPLQVLVRCDWFCPGSSDSRAEPTEFEILLTTGGPAVRIRGELDNSQPTRAYLQVQDWGTPWTDYLEADGDVLLTYAQQFYFGD